MNPAELQLPPTHRPHFFAGEILHAAELADVVAVERSLRWLHNRALHGWGIALGLTAVGAPGAKAVTVGAGYALDAGGRDIVLEQGVVLAVPPVASGPDGGPVDYVLVIAYTEDEAAVADLRDGPCDTAGAVRRHDDPTVAWRAPQAVREGLDIVIAAAKVAGCALAEPLATAGVRRTLGAIPSPRVATGWGGGLWSWWPSANEPVGVTATIDTTAGGFRDTPVYQATITGNRVFSSGGSSYFVDGHAHVERPRSDRFDVVVPLPEGHVAVGGATSRILAVNPRVPEFSLLDAVAGVLGWQVQWIGVEAG